ncbi:MAG TPA: pseudouridine synthase [Bacillota bacterium]|nr:pseudouridine synthase [Bacillota bacterium]HPT87941.1 pseudouridine synthase [Bacillota bacterium]
MVRLNKVLADAGIASRRQADRIIAAGRVRVNGIVVTEMGYSIDPTKDQVTVDGQMLVMPEKFEYWIMNKPAGYLTSVGDPFGRPTVMDLLPPMKARIYPVGRLDLDTSGLLFFTNDGDLALALTHPRHLVEKVYQAKVKGIPSQGTLKRLAEGVDLEDGRTAPAKVEIEAAENGYAIVRLTIREGRKRQVRRMLRTVGHPVVALHRLAVGPLWLGPLAPGKIRRPTPEELDALLQLKKLAIR